MCGICGFKGLKDKNLLLQMSETLRHRGPDQEGTHFDIENMVGLAHRRLSIIDLSIRARQPLTNEDHSIYLICNGEIYNFKDLREDLKTRGHKFRSDTDSEVIIHAYEEYQEECLKYFNGMFAFCLWDRNKREMFLARDRLGIKPLYYYLKDDIFIFASELKALLNHKEITRELNYDAIYLQLNLHYMPMEESVFKGIKHLLPGHYIKICNHTFKVKRYYQLQKKTVNLSPEEIRGKIFDILKNSVNLRLISDVPVAILLSGGLDSSAITALASASHGKVSTYTIGFGDKNFDLILINDVLHHVDNPYEVIKEVKRISRPGGMIIIIEANRYNPLFYLHMTKMLGHNHLTKGNFMNLITENFNNVEFKFVESHVWPTSNRFITMLLHKIERIIDKILFCRPFLAYNVAIIKI